MAWKTLLAYVPGWPAGGITRSSWRKAPGKSEHCVGGQDEALRRPRPEMHREPRTSCAARKAGRATGIAG